MYRPFAVVLVQLLLLSMALSMALPATATTLPVVRVAALKFGTVNWELDVIRRHALDARHGFKLEVVELISHNGSAVSLQGGASDVIVTDWLWVARQFEAQRYYHYFPYSTAAGELLVPGDSDLVTLGDIEGKTLGVAGSSEDKTWLLFRAYTREVAGYDLADTVDEHFATPPLLNGLMQAGRLEAILTYWHYAAALKAQGYRSVLSLEDVLKQFGMVEPVPILGWVFKRDWGQANPALVNAFLAASYEAKSLLLNSDEEWQALRPSMHDMDQPLFEELRQGYRRGVPRHFSDGDKAAIDRVARIVATGRPPAPSSQSAENSLPEEIFWQRFPADIFTANDER